MQLQLENLAYQQEAINAVIKIFDGAERNTFDNASVEGIRVNACSLALDQLAANAASVSVENGLALEVAHLVTEPEFCIEMETGTGKTLVYLRTIYELYQSYGFTKFIILVSSIAIREGTLTTLQRFEKQLEAVYGFTPAYFEYDSKKLSKVTQFVEDQHPQIMVMTLASFNADDRILNQAEREGLFANKPFIEALAQTRPIIIMDEPQEGMDTENAVARIARLNPLMKIRYSATHKVVKNLLYRLTPYDSYRQGLVKKIEVLTVAEKNDEATLKLELVEIQNGKAGDPKAKLRAWKARGESFVFAETRWLKVGDNVSAVTDNPSYGDYVVKRIYKSLRDGQWKVEFHNGVELVAQQKAANKEAIWRLQLEWMLRRHFEKSQRLRPQGVKVLSLVFIDRVANYMGEHAVIKRLFAEEYAKVFAEFNDGARPTPQQIANAQGFYFAQTGQGEFTDSEVSMRTNREIFDLILNQKEQLLSLDEPAEFIFSHTALGVGWDNPNVCNIATLNEAYSDVKKRQEIGRGLRICVNQGGQRVYDLRDTRDEARVNLLTVVPNETFETFVAQYQAQIKEVYGDTAAGAALTHTHKGESKSKVKFTRTQQESVNAAFKRFWQQLARKTDYAVAFAEDQLVSQAAERISQLRLADYVAEVSSQRIDAIEASGIQQTELGSEQVRLQARFAALDFIGNLAQTAHVSQRTAATIAARITNHDQFAKNPLVFVREASRIVRNVELEELVRGLTYHLTGEAHAIGFDDFERTLAQGDYAPSPTRGLWDKMLVDSDIEKRFTLAADNDTDVVCFLKLPYAYFIPTPIGEYHPDFGIVLKQRRLRDGHDREFYFVVETKGTNDPHDAKALTEAERLKIQCALKHFQALGVEIDYLAPVKEYAPTFKRQAEERIARRP